MVEQRRVHPNLPSAYFSNSSILLDLAAADDVDGFRLAVESGSPVNGSGLWYGARAGSRKMGYEERTPLMIAALYGSTNVLRYILAGGSVGDVDLAAGSDGVSALHLAASGASAASVEILLAASANPHAVNSNGDKPADLIPLIPKSPSANKIRFLLGGEATSTNTTTTTNNNTTEFDPVSPKGYSGAAPLPDINVGVYGSDEFRMYGFKIKPCSRAYTHDWTECPFAHPGENARRRDPLRHQYSCVPCPEFKKGSCRKADACEYAHGVFESWLHPAQYRTRLCKDETGCTRKVCFFAHRKDELRPVFASTGSAIESMDSGSPSSSPGSPNWAAVGKVKCSTPPPTLQLNGSSRLRSTSSARDVELEMELFRLESQISQQKQQRKLIDEAVYGRSFSGDLKPATLESVFASANCFSPNSPSPINHLRSSYPASATAPSRKLSPTELDRSPSSIAAAMLNSRAAAAFAKRSQSFIDRGSIATPLAGAYPKVSGGFGPSWGSVDGRADWSVQEGDLSKLRRSASFGQRGLNPRAASYGGGSVNAAMQQPDVSWVGAMVKEAPPRSPWIDQMYIEQEQMVA